MLACAKIAGQYLSMTYMSEAYGRYVIKSGPLAGKWAANAFRGSARVAKTSAETRERAVEAIKAELDRLDALAHVARDEEGAPSASVYRDAFEALIPTLPDSYAAMLRAHLASPERLISATGLAKAAGYVGYEGANLNYGRLGQRIAREIGFVPPRRADGTEIWTCAIARDPGRGTDIAGRSIGDARRRDVDGGHFEWLLRPQAVQALEALGW